MPHQKYKSAMFLKTLSLCLATAALSVTAHAEGSGGGGVGSGGGAWVCRDKQTREIQWIDLVDLNEGKRQWLLNIPSLDQDLGNAKTEWEWLSIAHDQVKKANNPEFAKRLEAAMQVVFKSFQLTEDSVFLPTEDFIPSTRPDPERTCPSGTIAEQPEQIANFTDEGTLLIQPALWNHPRMTKIGRAALILHEAVYLVLRAPDMGGDTNSRRTREIVAKLFGNLPIERIQAVLPEPKKVVKPEIAPVAGMYGEPTMTALDVTITQYDAHTGELNTTENNRDKRCKLINTNTYMCKKDGDRLKCILKSSSAGYRVRNDAANYLLVFDSSTSFVWTSNVKRTAKTFRYSPLTDKQKQACER